MIPTLIVIVLALYWLLKESDYLRVRLLVGTDVIPQTLNLQPQIDRMYREWMRGNFLKRISWGVCQMRYGYLKLSPNTEPICGWDWLQNNTHPIPEVEVDIQDGGVRHHWIIQDTKILNEVVKSLHYRKPKRNGHINYKRNKLGGLVAPLPPRPTS